MSRLYMTKSGHLVIRLDEFFGDPRAVNFCKCSSVDLETKIVSADSPVELYHVKSLPCSNVIRLAI